MRFPTGIKFNIQCLMLCIKIFLSYMAAQNNSNRLTSTVIATNGFSTILCDFETTYDTHPFIAWGKKEKIFAIVFWKCFILESVS